jgi:hypothetical protein
MQIPTINPRMKCPQIQLGPIDLDLQDEFRESFLDRFRSKSRRLSSREQLLEYFSHFFGLQVFQPKEADRDIWIYKFTVVNIKNEIGAADFGTSDIGLVVSIFLFFFHQPSVSVSLEGQLIEASTGRVISGYRINEKFRTSRSLFSRRIKSLPMIEVAAVKLLKHLKRDAEAELNGTN